MALTKEQQADFEERIKKADIEISEIQKKYEVSLVGTIRRHDMGSTTEVRFADVKKWPEKEELTETKL